MGGPVACGAPPSPGAPRRGGCGVARQPSDFSATIRSRNFVSTSPAIQAG